MEVGLPFEAAALGLQCGVLLAPLSARASDGPNVRVDGVNLLVHLRNRDSTAGRALIHWHFFSKTKQTFVLRLNGTRS